MVLWIFLVSSTGHGHRMGPEVAGAHRGLSQKGWLLAFEQFWFLSSIPTALNSSNMKIPEPKIDERGDRVKMHF